MNSPKRYKVVHHSEDDCGDLLYDDESIGDICDFGEGKETVLTITLECMANSESSLNYVLAVYNDLPNIFEYLKLNDIHLSQQTVDYDMGEINYLLTHQHRIPQFYNEVLRGDYSHLNAQLK